MVVGDTGATVDRIPPARDLPRRPGRSWAAFCPVEASHTEEEEEEEEGDPVRAMAHPAVTREADWLGSRLDCSAAATDRWGCPPIVRKTLEDPALTTTPSTAA